MPFVHLHNHSEYSLLDGMMHVRDMVRRAAELDMPAIALTDHGVMGGAVELCEACEAIERETGKKIKPIYGCEVYFTTDEALACDRKTDLYHMVLLAKTDEGYRNLLKLVSESRIDNYFNKPRVTLAMVQRFGEGVIGMSGCPSGLIPKLLADGQFVEACDWARKLAACFAPGDFYIELQDHGPVALADSGIKTEELNRLLVRVAKDSNLKVVATNDCHYLGPEDSEAHDVLVCVGTGAARNAARRMLPPNNQHYMKPEAEMRELFAEHPEACDNTIEIADKCNVQVKRETALPEPPIPGGESEAAWFCELCEHGLVERYGADDVGSYGDLQEQRPDVVARYELERDEMLRNGYAAYFIIVKEYVDWARNQGICMGPGRGPVVGSVVAYALGITDIDPLAHGLLFERFINPEHPEMPDIDLDIEQGRRDEVLKHLESLYGREHVARITTYGTFSAKWAVREAAHALGRPRGVAERICQMIGPRLGISIDEVLNGLNSELKAAYESERDVREIVDAARSIEGYLRGWGVHSCGIAVCRDQLIERTPLRHDASLEEAVTQYDGHYLKEVGVTKLDLLGMRSLDILSESCRNVEMSCGKILKPQDIPHEDDLAFALLRGELDCDAEGLFQLEGALYSSFFRRVQPTRFSEIVAAIALNRPGPLEAGMTDDYANAASGEKAVTYLGERLSPFLEETHGVLVYQEQVMQIAEEVCGFTPAEADDLRAALLRRDKPALRRFRETWVKGAAGSGYDVDEAQKAWRELELFGGYAFQKAHATAYAVLAMRTAYMKAHYPSEYVAAVLTAYVENEPRCIKLVDSCKRSGIALLCPDVNCSDVMFRPSNGGIRFGLAGIRALTQRKELAEAIVVERELGGPYSSPANFVERLGGDRFNPELVRELAKAGAFDSTGLTRKHVFGCAEPERQGGGEPSRELDGEEWAWPEILDREKEALGVYVSGHPLDAYSEAVTSASRWKICDLGGRSMGIKSGEFAGLVKGVIPRQTNSGIRKATFALEDKTGAITCATSDYDRLSDVLVEDAVVKVKGKLECSDLGNAIIVYDAQRIDSQ